MDQIDTRRKTFQSWSLCSDDYKSSNLPSDYLLKMTFPLRWEQKIRP